MSKDRIFSIITIICFCSIILIPIGIAIMWFSTKWKNFIKIIISIVLSGLYVGLFLLFLLFEPSINQNGVGVPLSFSKGKTEFNTEVTSSKKIEKEVDEFTSKTLKKGKKEKQPENKEHLPKSLKKNQEKTAGRLIWPIIFFLFLMVLIIIQNIRSSKKNKDYENPYVDTNQYKLPLSDDAKMPIVHFLKLRLNKDERINYATETNQKNNEGNFVVTNQRLVIYNKEEGEIDFPLSVLEAVASVSNSVIMLTSGSRKYYIFLPENQVKYALAVLRWSFKKITS